ncbi:unnamed protein product [Hermetia illucens]|uniref:Uncharacterized protein n=1 Tax=Hermetia illucens TaxID=343691 RepID=A0A7R8URI6_HERIL|nr:unnamed protein product [Hermetia illucens]
MTVCHFVILRVEEYSKRSSRRRETVHVTCPDRSYKTIGGPFTWSLFHTKIRGVKLCSHGDDHDESDGVRKSTDDKVALSREESPSATEFSATERRRRILVCACFRF